MLKYKRTGWFGHSHEHALAARGIRTYASKNQVMMEPFFYAQKHEEAVSFKKLMQETGNGASYGDLQHAHPDADKEDIRQRGIKAIEAREGSNVLSLLNKNGVDASVSMANSNANMKQRMLQVLDNHQKSSFLQSVKVEMLKKRLAEA